MRRAPVVAMLVLTLAALPARGLAAEPSRTDAAELTSAASGLDGTTVRIEGEVVSEALSGGEDHVWLNVLSAGTAVGAWMPVELALEVETFGDWGHTGDIVAVTGTFNEACDLHGGDLDIHATDLAVLERGSERPHPVQYWKLGVGVAGAVVALIGLRRARRIDEGDVR